MSWPTIAECKAYSADIPEVVASADSVITGKIADAKIFIKNHCKQEFDNPEEAGTTKYFNGNDTDLLDLFPRCTAITAVVDSSYDFTSLVNLKYSNNFAYLEGEYPTYDAGPRFIRSRNNEDPSRKLFLLGSNNIQVTGTWGWAAVPEDIENACMEIVERLIMKRLDIRQWMTPFKSERVSDGYSYQKNAAGSNILDYELSAKLDPYIFNIMNISKV